MSQAETVARPYAKAAYEQALAAKNVADWEEFLTVAASAMSDDAVTARLMAPGFIAQLRDWFDQYLKNKRESGLSAQEGNFLQVLSDHNRLDVLPEIARQFANLKHQTSDVCEVNVYSAKKLTKAQNDSIKALLKKKTGQDVSLTVKLSPELLAGVRIEYDGYVIDQSMKGRMADFARKLDDLRN